MDMAVISALPGVHKFLLSLVHKYCLVHVLQILSYWKIIRNTFLRYIFIKLQ